MKKILFFIFLSIFISNTSYNDFKEIKKKVKINKTEIIFPISENIDRCINIK